MSARGCELGSWGSVDLESVVPRMPTHTRWTIICRVWAKLDAALVKGNSRDACNLSFAVPLLGGSVMGSAKNQDNRMFKFKLSVSPSFSISNRLYNV